ncbi:MAG: hypothetical protein ACI361_08645 [Atopobiaceae bacterium]
MNATEELEKRCALTRSRKLGGLTPAGFEELERDVHENLSDFIETDDQRALNILRGALARYDDSVKDDDLRSDDEFMAERKKRFASLIASAQQAQAEDPTCLDAALIEALARDLDPEALLDALLRLEGTEEKQAGKLSDLATGTQDLWDDVYLRPRLRLRAATVRTCVDTAHYRMAATLGREALDAAPSDALGIRSSLALAYARLEDEPAFNELEAEAGHHGNSWWHLARVLLLFKLGRMPAARRALKGYMNLVRGGSYALLRPVFVELCIPDRPALAPNSFEEAMLAVHEADPIVADTPDFITWCEDQPWLVQDAMKFCDEEGLDWDA